MSKSEYHHGGFSLNIYTHETHLVYNAYNKRTRLKNGNFVKYMICQYLPDNRKQISVSNMVFPKLDVASFLHYSMNTTLVPKNNTNNSRLFICPKGHLVWDFMTFDSKSDCLSDTRYKNYMGSVSGRIKPTMFHCEIGLSFIFCNKLS